jgi:hypothetical protein
LHCGTIGKLDVIKKEAASITKDAWDHLIASYQYTYDIFGYPISRDNTDERYVYWFGIYDKDDPYVLPVNQTRDNAWVDGVMKATYNRLNSKAFTYECGCDPQKYPQDGPVTNPAWAESGNPYKMHICDNFWKEPVSGRAISQVGTLIHEATHYKDKDHEEAVDYAYQTGGNHDLAVNDRYKAVRNADSYLYYILDAPRP